MLGRLAVIILSVVGFTAVGLEADGAHAERRSADSYDKQLDGNSRDLKSKGPAPSPPPPAKAMVKPPVKATQAPSKGNQPAWKCGLSGACSYRESYKAEGSSFLDYCDTQPLDCPADDCNSVRGAYLIGKVVNPDVNSFSYNGGPSKGGPQVAVAADCCDACKNDKKCNVWTFCTKDGCGNKGNCSAYYKKYRSMIGPFGASGCTDDDRLAKGFCALGQATKSQVKKAKLQKPLTWTSGIIEKK